MNKPKRSKRGRQLHAVMLRAEGMSLREIARVLGCNHQTVANDLRDAAKLSNLPVYPKPRRRPEIDTELDAEIDTAKIIPLRRTQ